MYAFQTQSEKIDKIMQALFEAKKQIHEVPTNSDNLEYGSSYADLGAVWGTCKKPLEDNGLLVIQAPVPSARDGCLALETKVVHVVSEQWIASLAEIPLFKREPQAYGSALTYVRRYALCAVLGIVTKDDDANRASGKTPQPDSPPQPFQRPQQPSQPQAPRPQQLPSQTRPQPQGPGGNQQYQSRPQPSFPQQPQRPQGNTLPSLSGVNYSRVRGADGLIYIKAQGQTWPHHQRLLNLGFTKDQDAQTYRRLEQQQQAA